MTRVLRRDGLGSEWLPYKVLWLIFETEAHYVVTTESKDGLKGTILHAVPKTDYMKEGDDLL